MRLLHTARFVAMTKQYPVDYAANTRPAGPRTVWMSTSTDFVHWTAPRPSFAADLRDDAAITDPAPSGHARWPEIYGMPAIRYGEQYLGLPWVFDITDSPTTLADPGPDKGRQHVGLAASKDLLTWSRPSLGDLITPGAAGSWDWGWDLTGTTLLTVGDQVRLYYPVPGYTAADATPVTADTLGAPVSWGAKTTLPAGPLRLRFDLTAGDLYSYTIG